MQVSSTEGAIIATILAIVSYVAANAAGAPTLVSLVIGAAIAGLTAYGAAESTAAQATAAAAALAPAAIAPK